MPGGGCVALGAAMALRRVLQNVQNGLLHGRTQLRRLAQLSLADLLFQSG